MRIKEKEAQEAAAAAEATGAEPPSANPPRSQALAERGILPGCDGGGRRHPAGGARPGRWGTPAHRRQAGAHEPRRIGQGPDRAAHDRGGGAGRAAEARGRDRGADEGQHRRGPGQAAAIKGYRCIFVMADKQSEEKRALLRAYGAEVVICPTDVDPDDERSYYWVSIGSRARRPVMEAGPVRQGGQPRGALPDHRPGDLGRDRGASPPGGGPRDGRHRQRCRSPYERTRRRGGIGADPVGSVYSGADPHPLPDRRGSARTSGRPPTTPISATCRAGQRPRFDAHCRAGDGRRGDPDGESCGTALWAAAGRPDLDDPTRCSWCSCPTVGGTTSASCSTTTGYGRAAFWRRRVPAAYDWRATRATVIRRRGESIPRLTAPEERRAARSERRPPLERGWRRPAILRVSRTFGLNGANVPSGFVLPDPGVQRVERRDLVAVRGRVSMKSSPNSAGGSCVVQASAKTTYSSATSFSLPFLSGA